MPSWRVAQSKKQIARKTKLAIVAIALVALLLFLSQSVKFTQVLFSPWKTVPVQRNFFWNGDFNINILVRSLGISLVSFSKQNQNLTVINIPDSTFLEVSDGLGKWQISSVYGLGLLQGVWGGILLEKSVTNLFGLPIEGFLDFSGEYSKLPPEQIIDEIRKNPFSFFSFLPHVKTDLTPFELIRLQTGLSGLRFDKVKKVDLEKTNILEKQRLPDGTDVLTTEPSNLDGVVSDMLDPLIAKEKKTIAIFNCTDHPQLAQKAARLIANIGGDVIIVSNGQKRYEKTNITGEKSKTLERLGQIFVADGKIDPGDEDLISSRAQINLFLGEDYFKNF